jgi:hypothetical protein
MRYKIKVVMVDGELLYRPMYKKFLFWHSIPIVDMGFGAIYSNTDYDTAVNVINRHKKENHKCKIKHISDIPVD